MNEAVVQRYHSEATITWIKVALTASSVKVQQDIGFISYTKWQLNWEHMDTALLEEDWAGTV